MRNTEKTLFTATTVLLPSAEQDTMSQNKSGTIGESDNPQQSDSLRRKRRRSTMLRDDIRQSARMLNR